MNQIIFSSAFLLPVGILIVVGVAARYATSLEWIVGLAKTAPVIGLLAALCAGIWVFNDMLFESETLGRNGLGLSLRFDQLSVIIYGMVSIIALVIIRFSHSYLEGDAQHIRFIGRLSLTIAFVQLLVLSGNMVLLWITWVATSIALHQLLIFYPERKKAKIAAIKKFIVARMGDTTLLVALSLIYTTFHTGNLEVIFNALRQLDADSLPLTLEWAAVLMVLTAGLKSAQIPFHGWLLDVMEAPTPVSALLHAGLLNAGPFLMIRFAYLLDVTSLAPVLLFVMGAATAFYGALVFTTQPMVKTALAYSSVAHMGFTLMVCGLGVYSASLLHLVAHSFYKAHAFLSSGSIVEKVRTKQASNFKRRGSIWRIIFGFGTAIVLYVMVAQFWKINAHTQYQVLVIGGIIFTGIISLIINAIDSSNYKYSTLIILLCTVGVLMSFFCMEQFMHGYLGSQIPNMSVPTPFMMYLSGATLMIFFFTVLIQSLSPVLQKGEAFKSFGIHARNGFYLNDIMDQMLKALLHKNYKI